MTKFLLDIPYFSQWESPEMVGDILETKRASIDPKWKNSGARSKKEYEIWSWNICGMACLKMILAKKYGKEYKIVQLAKKCEKYGGYRPEGNNIEGLFYDPFLKYLKTEFGIKGRIYRRFLTIRTIQREMEKGGYFMVSVSRLIRHPETYPETKGGHLVLMTGFDKEKKTLFLHNPSGFYNKSQENFEINEKDFKKFFAGRGILIY